MKPEEYPHETSCKYANIVTGELEFVERMNTRSGSLKTLSMKKKDRIIRVRAKQNYYYY